MTNSYSYIYWLVLVAVILMIITLALTWKSALPRDTKWLLSVISVMFPWVGWIVFLIINQQHKVRLKRSD